MSARPCSAISCTDIKGFGATHEVCTFNADPDVAGIGILLSFIVVGATAFLLSGYIFFYVESGFARELLNELDHNCIQFVRKWTWFAREWTKFIGKWTRFGSPTGEEREERVWSTKFRMTLCDIVIMLSDLQHVLGFSILTVGYFRFGSTTQYHFAIMSALANISFVVHVSTFPVLKGIMPGYQEKIDLKNFKRIWRAVARICFDILLFASLWPTGNTSWLNDYGISASCIWRDSNGNHRGTSFRVMIANMVLLAFGIWYELNEFFPVISDNCAAKALLTWSVWVLMSPKRTREKMKTLRNDYRELSPCSVKTRLCLLVEYSCWTFSVIILMCTEITYSQSLGLTRNWAMLVSNSRLIFHIRARATERGRIGDENVWSFGQGVAMFVLLLPLCLAIELYYDHWVKSRPGKHNLSALISATSIVAAQEAWTGTTLEAEPGKPLNTRISVAGRTKEHCSWVHDCSRCFEAAKASQSQPPKRRNAFYFGFPDATPNQFDFEREMYGRAWFQCTMILLQLSIFALVTYWAVKGWAF